MAVGMVKDTGQTAKEGYMQAKVRRGDKPLLRLQACAMCTMELSSQLPCKPSMRANQGLLQKMRMLPLREKEKSLLLKGKREKGQIEARALRY